MYLRDMLILIEPCTLRALFVSHNIAKNVCSLYMYIIISNIRSAVKRQNAGCVYFCTSSLGVRLVLVSESVVNKNEKKTCRTV